MSQVVRTFEVFGRVQGVGFRAFTKDKAIELGLSGWVRNTVDRTVEGEVRGTQVQVDQFLFLLKKGPALARVDNIVTNNIETDQQYHGFEIRF